MIKIFKKNGALQLLVILAVSLCIWGGSFANPRQMEAPPVYAPLYSLLCQLLNGAPLVGVILGYLLTIGEGYVLTRILYTKRLIQINSLMPMLVYLIAMSCGMDHLGLSVGVLVNMWLLLALWVLMPDENMVVSKNGIFNALLFIAMSTLFYMPSVLLLVPIAIIFTVYKIYTGREWALALLGYLAPLIILFTMLFMTDRMDVMVACGQQLANMWAVRMDPSTGETIYFAAFILLGLVFFFKAMSLTTTKIQSQRKHEYALSILLMYGCAMLFYERTIPPDGQAFAIPLALLGSDFFMAKRKKIWAVEIILWITMLMSGYSYYCELI